MSVLEAKCEGAQRLSYNSTGPSGRPPGRNLRFPLGPFGPVEWPSAEPCGEPE